MKKRIVCITDCFDIAYNELRGTIISKTDYSLRNREHHSAIRTLTNHTQVKDKFMRNIIYVDLL